MRTLPIQSRRAFSLAEVMVTTAILAMIMAGITVGVLALQRSFFASKDFAAAHADQVRVCDYLQRDGRAATEIKISEGGRAVTMKIPLESNGLVGLDLPSSLVSILGGSSAPATKSVLYRFVDGEVIRNDGATRHAIATRLSRFHVEAAGGDLKLQLAFRSTYGNRAGEEVSASTMLANVRIRTAAMP